MARGSLKQRKNQKRSISPPTSPSMAKTPPPSSRFNCRRISISFLLLSSFVFLLIYTTTKTTLFSVSSSQIYSIEVINEYPHDPNAFTQVTLSEFRHSESLILMLQWLYWVCLDVPQFDNGWVVSVKMNYRVWELSGVEIGW